MKTGSVHKQSVLHLQLVKTPEGGRAWFKPEMNWHRNYMTGGATQQLQKKNIQKNATNIKLKQRS